MHVTSMDVSFERGPDAAPASVWEQPQLSNMEAMSAATAGIFYRFAPVIVKVVVYFADEGTMRAWYHVDAAGNVETVNAGNDPNTAKGIGKGTYHVR